MDGQPLFPGDSEVDQLFVIQKVLGPLPDFLQDEFCRNTRYQGLKFPDISHPETIEVRYSPVMNDIEIDLMKKLLEMDPYQRMTAKQALNHEFFDDLRSKDSDYDEDESLSVEINNTLGQDSGSQIIRGNKRILSPDMVTKQKPG